MTTNTGDRIVRDVLGSARRDANWRRLLGWEHSTFDQGMAHGQIIVAQHYLGADPLAVKGAHNELHFLRRYTEARA